MRKFAHVCFRHAQLLRMSISDMRGIRAHVLVSARAALLEKGLSNRPVKYTVMKRKQCVSFLVGLVIQIILIYLDAPI